MAKQLLLNALAKVLGEFIDISEENLNLSLAVWSGQIVLNNLKLKTDSFVRTFNLSILHGYVRFSYRSNATGIRGDKEVTDLGVSTRCFRT